MGQIQLAALATGPSLSRAFHDDSCALAAGRRSQTPRDNHLYSIALEQCMHGKRSTLAAGKEESDSEDSDDDDFDEKPAPKKRAPAARPSSAGKAKAGPQLKKAKGQVGSNSLLPLTGMSAGLGGDEL